ncbi:anthrone oxygenase family protein [Devosia nitrariae]|uniref:DUF1772 domain-containing protein n=1 Tax=Devosia nitrariae TaxID=2071872 RepID=A0ABQ5WA33_9HYPH|nr:anthrone oxygenase family protein [Devosia nitrariae]GLQ56942.1 hypothetical protein GCM10010862_42010 [Devosia nitrariae]
MSFVLEILAVLAAAVALAPSLAHALEYPGKLRLDRLDYMTVQPIYYPGFTMTGFAEPVAALLALGLLFVLPAGSSAFWWALVGFVALVAMHVTYWLVTHPVNRVWLKEERLHPTGERFFAAGGGEEPSTADEDWEKLRNRWEYSHMLRAALAGLGLVSLTITAAL